MSQSEPVKGPVELATTLRFEEEVKRGERFTFGENWRAFLGALNAERIAEAEASLKFMLDVNTLEGKMFLDVGSGSGLFSLAARRLGAKVHSFDYDPSSVSCARELRLRYFPNDRDWTIEQGSVLDQEYLEGLKPADIVYSWGVLHHTGEMWKALEFVAPLVKPQGGKLFIALYNDQGRASKVWKWIKQTYCQCPPLFKPFILYSVGLRLWGPRTILDLVQLRPFETWRNYYTSRGMSPWRDVVDWVGGYPFEVAKPDEIFDFYRQRGFTLCRLKTVGGALSNNEFVFEREAR